MNKRLREVRKTLGLKQREVAAAVHVADSTVAAWESGYFTPSDRTISMFCTHFHVNETWLRTDEGNMFADTSKKEQILDFVSNALANEETFKARFITALATMTPEEWDALEKLVHRFSDKSE